MISNSRNAQDRWRRLDTVVLFLALDLGMMERYLQCDMKARSPSHLDLQDKVILWRIHCEDDEVPSSNVPRWQVTKQRGFYVHLWETRGERTCLRVGVCDCAGEQGNDDRAG